MDYDKYQILLEQKFKNERPPFLFDGFNCNEYRDENEKPCDGWDGISRRCNCGNRRVSWVLSDDGEFIYGEAW